MDNTTLLILIMVVLIVLGGGWSSRRAARPKFLETFGYRAGDSSNRFVDQR